MEESEIVIDDRGGKHILFEAQTRGRVMNILHKRENRNTRITRHHSTEFGVTRFT